MSEQEVKGSKLKAGDVIRDPEGNLARVSRVRMIDQTRLRLETDIGVRVIARGEKILVISP